METNMALLLKTSDAWHGDLSVLPVVSSDVIDRLVYMQSTADDMVPH